MTPPVFLTRLCAPAHTPVCVPPPGPPPRGGDFSPRHRGGPILGTPFPGFFTPRFPRCFSPEEKPPAWALFQRPLGPRAGVHTPFWGFVFSPPGQRGSGVFPRPPLPPGAPGIAPFFVGPLGPTLGATVWVSLFSQPGLGFCSRALSSTP